jgi:hypothetical protein
VVVIGDGGHDDDGDDVGIGDMCGDDIEVGGKYGDDH